MSEDASARLGLPLLFPGQAQKELDHNEALALLDIAVQPVVVAVGVDQPPEDPAEGACWIVGPAPTGAWAGRAQALAGWTAGGWRFVMPGAGFRVWSLADAADARFDGAAWTIGENASQQPPIADPVGGPTIDTEARETIAEILQALRVHGLIAT